MSQDKLEQEFNAYMDGDSSLSADYQKASLQQPPAQLDDAILAASRRSVKSKPRYAFSPFASDWHIPFSLAAVLVLSVTVIITMQRENDEGYLTAPQDYQQGESIGVVDGKSADVVSDFEMLPVKDRADVEEEFPVSDLDWTFSEKPAASAPVMIIEQKSESARKVINRNLKKEIALPAERSKEVISDGPGQNEALMESYAPSPAAIRSLSAPGRVLKSDEQVKQRESTRREFNQSDAMLRKKSNVEYSTDKIQKMQSKMSVELRQATEDVSSSGLSSEGAYQASPEEWLTNIRQLWTAGNKGEAIHQLQLFNEHYPGYEPTKLQKSLDRDLIDAAEVQP